jgi:uncharacterized protein (TIGR02680 family)
VTAAIDRLHPGSSRRLPHAGSDRFVPLRAGIRNVWEYDDQEFWFAGGRLLLRGQNTAGKSKALELLFPFVLDGDMRSERLDPFGSKSKTMYWNLIDFADRQTAIGYCWAEFGRRDGHGAEQYVTLLVGMRAVRSAGRKVEPWFAVTPARIGVDLDLAPGGYPLTADRLREALPEPSRFNTVAREHRLAVDQALFGLGPERFDALIHLLLQLRRPKLSEKLDMARLSLYLTDALPPLEQPRMEALAQAFARLDDDTAEIEALEASLHEVESFLEVYRAHAQVQTRLRADEVRSANSSFDKVTETERLQRQARDRANDELADIELRRDGLSNRIAELDGALEGLDLSKVHALVQVEARAADAQTHAGELRDRAGTDAGIADRAAAAAERAQATAAAAELRRVALDAVVAERSEPAGLVDLHDVHRAQLSAQPDAARAALEGAARRRADVLRGVRKAAKDAQTAQAGVNAAARADQDAKDELADAELGHAERSAVAELGAEQLVMAVAAWTEQLDVDVPASYAESVVETVAQGEQPSPAELFVAAREALRSGRTTVLVASQHAEAERSDLAEQRGRIAAEVDDAPPPSPGRPLDRPDGCAPLWACVDFAPDLPAEGRACVEAALEAAGLLDALVTPVGTILDASTFDTWLTPGGEPTHWLVPVADGPLDPVAVEAALSALGGVSPDGSWVGGGLTGRWSKPEPEYIGAAARASARRRRIAALTERIAELEDRLAELAAEELAILQRQERLRLDEQSFPFRSAVALRNALRDVEAAIDEVARRRERARSAAARLLEIEDAAREVLGALLDAEVAAGCRAAEVDDALDALEEYRRGLADLAAAAERVLDLSTTAADAVSKATEAAEIAARSDTAATEAERNATQMRSQAAELRRSSGADVDAILARQRQLNDGLEAAGREQERLAGARDEARDQLARAETQLENTEVARREAEAVRAEALQRLARVASSELGVLAVGPVDPGRDLTQVTAGRNFARTAHDLLRDLALDQRSLDAVTNRFHRGFSTLRSQLGAAYDPYLDQTDGIEVCSATLNGKPVAISELAVSLTEQVRRRRQTLTDEERRLIERHLLTEVGTHLGERVHAAWSLVKRMNDQLASHPTRGGVSLRLSWMPAPDISPDALGLLRREIALLDATERATLAAFLQERVRIAREDTEGADVVERLAAALDYRRWHRFSITRRSATGEERLTTRTQSVGSGGEQAKLAHLPLFAATAAYYSSALPTAPHLLMLDEAFAGIDDAQKADCMHMLVDLELDVVLTNFAEFGCYPEVPALAIYHLERTPGQLGVTALRFVWNGTSKYEDDPFLDDLQPRVDDGLFA